MVPIVIFFVDNCLWCGCCSRVVFKAGSIPAYNYSIVVVVIVVVVVAEQCGERYTELRKNEHII